MRVLIVDDESLARARLKRLLGQHASFTCIGEAASAKEALALSFALLPDLVFLDIEMPDGDGLSVAEQLLELKPPPAVVFVTAHPQHALAAYQVAPADYLLKPVSAERLALTLSRLGAKTRAHLEKTESNWLSYRNGLMTSRVALSEVIYLQAGDKYVRLVFAGGEALIEQSLKQLEEQYPKELLRIHRNTLVNASRVKAIHQTPDGKHLLELTQHPDLLEISRRELAKLRQILL